jgi:hypothetical protein
MEEESSGEEKLRNSGEEEKRTRGEEESVVEEVREKRRKGGRPEDNRGRWILDKSNEGF